MLVHTMLQNCFRYFFFFNHKMFLVLFCSFFFFFSQDPVKHQTFLWNVQSFSTPGLLKLTPPPFFCRLHFGDTQAEMLLYGCISFEKDSVVHQSEQVSLKKRLCFNLGKLAHMCVCLYFQLKCVKQHVSFFIPPLNWLFNVLFVCPILICCKYF